MTAVFATVFFVISLALGNMSTHKSEYQGVDVSQSQSIEKTKNTSELSPSSESDEIPK
jgi:preprotein translocase subunit SecG